ncbi:hypothetical protein ABT369_18255 [Dactylosporangium sp. NPDC000244]|uniref:hypothetical protein n=1 Tax=Dactylosporangium sp. NPDC000244 TaxID=3154365 RepID=UPI00332BBAF6
MADVGDSPAAGRAELADMLAAGDGLGNAAAGRRLGHPDDAVDPTTCTPRDPLTADGRTEFADVLAVGDATPGDWRRAASELSRTGKNDALLPFYEPMTEVSGISAIGRRGAGPTCGDGGGA